MILQIEIGVIFYEPTLLFLINFLFSFSTGFERSKVKWKKKKTNIKCKKIFLFKKLLEVNNFERSVMCTSTT